MKGLPYSEYDRSSILEMTQVTLLGIYIFLCILSMSCHSPLPLFSPMIAFHYLLL